MSSDAVGAGDRGGPIVHVEHLRDLSRTLEPAPEAPGSQTAPYLVVTFESGRTALLDLSRHRSAVWADVLESLRQSDQPVYVQIDPESGFITELLQPRIYTVHSIRPVPDGIDVELEVSHAIHRVRSSNPNFADLRGSLEAALALGAPVLVTDALDGPEIIDVRPPIRRAPAEA